MGSPFEGLLLFLVLYIGIAVPILIMSPGISADTHRGIYLMRGAE